MTSEVLKFTNNKNRNLIHPQAFIINCGSNKYKNNNENNKKAFHERNILAFWILYLFIFILLLISVEQCPDRNGSS